MIYSFEEYELDLQRYELRGAGRPIKIEPQVFNLLAYLIQHRDRLITKEELLEQLWSGRVVGEATLTSRVRAARKAVADAGRVQRLIQTLHGRGYRFIAPIEERPGDTAHLREPPPSSGLSSLTEPHEGHTAAMRPPRHRSQAVLEPRAETTLQASADQALPSRLLPSAALRAVGRGLKLAQLHSWLQQALGGDAAGGVRDRRGRAWQDHSDRGLLSTPRHN